MAENKKNTSGRGSVGWRLYAFYILMLFAAVFVLVRIVFLQLTFKPDPEVAKVFRPSTHCEEVQAARGNILSCDGRMLAITYPEYTLHMDCTVQADTVWNKYLDSLCMGLSAIFKDKSAVEYKSILQKGRKEHSKFVKIGSRFDLKTLRELEKLPILSKGRYKGGMLTETRNSRHYPYGTLGRRTIGFVRDPGSQVKNTHIGLEGKFDYVLHGREGVEWTRKTDVGTVLDNDSTKTRPVDGRDIRTTLNIDYQDIAYRALHDEIKEESDLEGACLVLIEASTGAIRAMVNLYRDGDSPSFEEVSNLAIGRSIEPGSVFKTVTLMQVLSDGHIKSLDETIPTNHGVIKGVKGVPQDVHILDHERIHHINSISVIDGFKISSNYVFGTLAVSNYGKKPMRFIENIHSYKLGEAFDFDLAGLASPTIPSPKDKNRYWSLSDLAVMGYGYGARVTPMHVLCFYNAIANKGKMMKPYLVEDIEQDGVVKERRGPALMSTICSRAVADTLTRALKAVTEEGTARRLKDARCNVAGKTGTSFGTYAGGKYRDEQGRRKYQGTFVGFFPAEDPRYSVICTVFSKPTSKQFQGGGIPARAVKSLVNGIYSIDPCFQPVLTAAK